MSKILRQFQKLFGATNLAGQPQQFKKFGGYVAGDSANATTIALMQSLGAFGAGFFSAVSGDGAPCAEDLNSLHYMEFYQLCYMLQQGVAEWDASTTYYTGSIVNVLGQLYRSLVDTNINQSPLANTSYWMAIPYGMLWNSDVSYIKGDIVSYGGALYISVVNNNVANVPSASLSQWMVYSPGALNPQASPALAIRATNAWPVQAGAENNLWNRICWSHELGLFCAVAGTGTHRVMTSPDGKTWTAQTAAAASTWSAVAWSPELRLFCAVSALGNIMTSPDGATWTSQSPTETTGFYAIIWVAELGLFVASGAVGSGTHSIQTSPDGIIWTGRTQAESNTWVGLSWSPELGLLCAVASGGTHRAMTSPDGITWTAQTTGAIAWTSVHWSPQLRMFAAVGAGGNATISRDGVNWLTFSLPEAVVYNDVGWSPQLGVFIAVSGSAATYRIAYSRDGQVWTGVPGVSSGATWNGIAWAAQLGIFAIVGAGATNDVLISRYVRKFLA